MGTLANHERRRTIRTGNWQRGARSVDGEHGGVTSNLEKEVYCGKFVCQEQAAQQRVLVACPATS